MTNLKLSPSGQSKSFVSYTKKISIAFRNCFRQLFDYKNDVLLGYEYRPHYALCLLMAAEGAKKIGVKSLKVFELGCAGGSGLIDLQYLTKRVESYTGVFFEIHGFDYGIGMPPSKDVRDCLYLWKEGEYPMDREKLETSLLSSTQLHIGDVADTLHRACNMSESPIGVIIFDVDYYTSTKSALDILRLLPSKALLPRTITYFDDFLFTSDYSGELLAINEFNETSRDRKISRIPHLSSYLSLKWKNWIYLGEKILYMHSFNHKQYSVMDVDATKVKGKLDLI